MLVTRRTHARGQEYMDVEFPVLGLKHYTGLLFARGVNFRAGNHVLPLLLQVWQSQHIVGTP